DSVEEEGFENENINEEGEINNNNCWIKLSKYKLIVNNLIDKKNNNIKIFILIILLLFISTISIFIILFVIDSFTLGQSNSELDVLYNNNNDNKEFNLNYGLLNNDCFDHLNSNS